MKRVLSIIMALAMMFTLAFSLGIETSATSLIKEDATMIGATREIPEGAVEIQTGLYAVETSFTMGGVHYMFYDIYSAEGYCFWEVSQPENYVNGDVNGELLPLEERIFAQYASTAYSTIEELNANFISVPVQDGYEIVSVGGNDHETA